MTTDTAPDGERMRLFYHRASSASMRVTLYLRCRSIPASLVELVSTGFETDHRGIPVFTMPEGDPETEKLGTTDLTAFNPEGRIPVLLLPGGRKMTQSGPIVDYLEESIGALGHRPMMPDDPWLRAQVRRIMRCRKGGNPYGLDPRTDAFSRESRCIRRRPQVASAMSRCDLAAHPAVRSRFRTAVSRNATRRRPA